MCLTFTCPALLSFQINILRENRPAMSVTEHYRGLQASSADAFKDLVAGVESLTAFTVAHNYIVDFELLQSAIRDRPEARLFELAVWPVPGLEDTELGVFMEPEVGHGTTTAYAGVQA